MEAAVHQSERFMANGILGTAEVKAAEAGIGGKSLLAGKPAIVGEALADAIPYAGLAEVRDDCGATDKLKLGTAGIFGVHGLIPFL